MATNSQFLLCTANPDMLPIHIACVSGDLHAVKEIHREYVLLEENEEYENMECSPLIDTSNASWVDCIFGETTGYYPLHSAAKGGNGSIIAYMLDNTTEYEDDVDYIDINCTDSNGMTPLYTAYYFGHQSCIDILNKAGADTQDTWNEFKEYTIDQRLSYIEFVEACVLDVVVEGEQQGHVLTASVDDFCGNAFWTRELMSYIGIVDENIRLY